MSYCRSERDTHAKNLLSDYVLIRLAMDIREMNKGNAQLGNVRIKWLGVNASDLGLMRRCRDAV